MRATVYTRHAGLQRILQRHFPTANISWPEYWTGAVFAAAEDARRHSENRLPIRQIGSGGFYVPKQ